MDTEIFKAVNGLAGQVGWLDVAMESISEYAIYASVLTVLLLFIRHRKAAFAGVIGIVIGLVVDVLIQLLYTRPHPFSVLDNMTLLADREMSASFPSDTAMMAFAAALAVWLASKKWGWIALIAAAVVAFSRIYVGFHFPGDVLAGTIIGLATTGAVYKVLPGTRNARGKQNHFPM